MLPQAAALVSQRDDASGFVRALRVRFFGGCGSSESQAVDRMLVADSDRQHAARRGVDVAIDQAKTPGQATGHVELDAGEAGVNRPGFDSASFLAKDADHA